MHREAEVKELNQDFKGPCNFFVWFVNADRKDRKTMLCPPVSDV